MKLKLKLSLDHQKVVTRPCLHNAYIDLVRTGPLFGDHHTDNLYVKKGSH